MHIFVFLFWTKSAAVHSVPIIRSMAAWLLVPLKRRKWQPWAETLNTTGHLEPTQLSPHTKETFLKQTHVSVCQDAFILSGSRPKDLQPHNPIICLLWSVARKRYISMIKHRHRWRAAPCLMEVGCGGWGDWGLNVPGSRSRFCD